MNDQLSGWRRDLDVKWDIEVPDADPIAASLIESVCDRVYFCVGLRVMQTPSPDEGDEELEEMVSNVGRMIVGSGLAARLRGRCGIDLSDPTDPVTGLLLNILTTVHQDIENTPLTWDDWLTGYLVHWRGLAYLAAAVA